MGTLAIADGAHPKKVLLPLVCVSFGGPIVARIFSGSDGKSAALLTDLVVSAITTYYFFQQGGSGAGIATTVPATFCRFIVYLFTYAVT